MQTRRTPTGAFQTVQPTLEEEFDDRWQHVVTTYRAQPTAPELPRKRQQTLRDVPIPGRRVAAEYAVPPEPPPISTPMRQEIAHLRQDIGKLYEDNWRAAALRDSTLVNNLQHTTQKLDQTSVYMARFGSEIHELRQRVDTLDGHLAAFVKLAESKENRETRLQMMPLGARLIAKYGTDSLLLAGVAACVFLLAFTMVITAVREPRVIRHQDYAAVGGMNGGR